MDETLKDVLNTFWVSRYLQVATYTLFDVESDSDTGEEEDDGLENKKRKPRLELSEEEVMKWEENIESTNSLQGLRKVTSAFRSIIEIDDKKKVSNRGFSLALTSSPVLNSKFL